MTDKQIIIDGCDVSGCDFLAKEDDYCSYSGVTYAYKGQCMCSDEEMCKEHPNCFYKKNLKQLKRKEQECEKAKQNAQDTYELYQSLIESFNILQVEKIKLEQECEGWQAELAYKDSELQNIEEKIKPLMKRLDDLDCYDLEWIICAFADEFNQLKAENKELKKQLESTKGLVTVGNNQLAEALLVLQKYEDNEQQEKEMQKLYNKFKGNSLIENKEHEKGLKAIKTLVEIKEIAEEKAKVSDWLALEILQKINEVDNDN